MADVYPETYQVLKDVEFGPDGAHVLGTLVSSSQASVDALAEQVAYVKVQTDKLQFSLLGKVKAQVASIDVPDMSGQKIARIHTIGKRGFVTAIESEGK